MRTILTWLALVVCVCLVALPTMAAAVPATSPFGGPATVQQSATCELPAKALHATFKPCGKKVNGVATLCHPLPALMPQIPTLNIEAGDDRAELCADLPLVAAPQSPMFRPPRA